MYKRFTRLNTFLGFVVTVVTIALAAYYYFVPAPAPVTVQDIEPVNQRLDDILRRLATLQHESDKAPADTDARGRILDAALDDLTMALIDLDPGNSFKLPETTHLAQTPGIERRSMPETIDLRLHQIEKIAVLWTQTSEIAKMVFLRRAEFELECDVLKHHNDKEGYRARQVQACTNILAADTKKQRLVERRLGALQEAVGSATAEAKFIREWQAGKKNPTAESR